MRLVVLFFICHFSFFTVSAQPDYEKIAFEYFVKNVMPDQFPNYKNIKFSGTTDKTVTNSNYFDECYERDGEFLNQLKGNFPDKEEKAVNISSELKRKVKICKVSKNTKKPYVTINRANILEAKIFVAVNIQQKNGFYLSYFFHLSKSGEVIDWCYSGEIY
jgi:hypothetical protein